MIDEKTVWDDIWPVVEQLISTTVAEDPRTLRQLLHPHGQATDALDMFGIVVFDILLKTVLGRDRVGLVRAIEGDGGETVFIEYAWPDPTTRGRYTAVDVVAVRLAHTGDGWRVVEINPAGADLPLNGARAASILAGTQAINDDGKPPSEPWVLPVALYAGLLQLPLQPEAAADPVEELLLPGLQARRFGFLPQIYARRLWRDFVTAADGDFDPADRPGAWAAAVELLMGEQENRAETQAAVGRRYHASLGAVAGRAKQIRRALNIEGFDARYSDFSTTEIVYKETDE